VPSSEHVAWHALTVTEDAEELQSDPARGLTEVEATRRLAQSGPNRLAEPRGRSSLVILHAQFRHLIVLFLITAAAIAFALGENIEAVAIRIVIVLNAATGFMTEWKAEQALAALQKHSVSVAQVIRDGDERRIPAADLVPGDLVGHLRWAWP
jgi:Ca2+-transporting ATPase